MVISDFVQLGHLVTTRGQSVSTEQLST